MLFALSHAVDCVLASTTGVSHEEFALLLLTSLHGSEHAVEEPAKDAGERSEPVGGAKSEEEHGQAAREVPDHEDGLAAEAVAREAPGNGGDERREVHERREEAGLTRDAPLVSLRSERSGRRDERRRETQELAAAVQRRRQTSEIPPQAAQKTRACLWARKVPDHVHEERERHRDVDLRRTDRQIAHNHESDVDLA